MDLLKFIFVLPLISVMPKPCFASQNNRISQIGEVTCNSFGITTNINLQNGFKGVVYAENHFIDPICRYDGIPESNGSISFFVSMNNCGTRVQELDDYIYFSNTIVIQKHILAETASDMLHKVFCKINLSQMPNLNEIPKDGGGTRRSYIHQTDGIQSWMEFKVDTEILSAPAANTLRVGDSFLLVVHLKDGGKNNNLRVTECWAHDGATVDNSVYSIQIFHTCESSDFITEFTSAKSIFNVSDIVTYAKLNAFKLPSVVNLQFSCSIEVCRKDCLGYCNNVSYSGGNNHIVPMRKREKRSAMSNFSNKSMDERIRLMKATIKALGAKLLNNRSQRHSENGSDFNKRMLKDLSTDLIENYEVTEMANEKDTVATSVDISNLDYADGGFGSAATPEDYSESMWNNKHHFNLTNSIIILSSRESILSDDIQDDSGSAANCVSRLRFNLVTAMLCSLLFCIILTCIGLALYLRKEKKKHLIDSFLLYNFY